MANTDFFDEDGHCLPFNLIEELYSKLDYGTPLSCWIKILEETGCRINETNEMRFSFIHEGQIYWKLGKNQRGYYRKETLSKSLLAEIYLMRSSHRVMGDSLLPCHAHTLRRYFNKFIMPSMSKPWHETRRKLNKMGFSYERRFQLRSFRKNFQTILFYYYWKKYSDASIALEMVSKRMKHSSTGMTIRHYIENVEQLGLDNLQVLITKRPFEWISTAGQTKLYQYYRFTECCTT